jgi:hypothetical protein
METLVSLRFDPAVYSNPGRRHLSKRKLPELTEPVSAVRWSTPRHGGVYSSNVMTRRPGPLRRRRRTEIPPPTLAVFPSV